MRLFGHLNLGQLTPGLQVGEFHIFGTTFGTTEKGLMFIHPSRFRDQCASHQVHFLVIGETWIAVFFGSMHTVATFPW